MMIFKQGFENSYRPTNGTTRNGQLNALPCAKSIDASTASFRKNVGRFLRLVVSGHR